MHRHTHGCDISTVLNRCHWLSEAQDLSLFPCLCRGQRTRLCLAKVPCGPVSALRSFVDLVFITLDSNWPDTLACPEASTHSSWSMPGAIRDSYWCPFCPFFPQPLMLAKITLKAKQKKMSFSISRIQDLRSLGQGWADATAEKGPDLVLTSIPRPESIPAYSFPSL